MRATREAGFGDEVKRRIILGTYALSSGYYDAYYGQAQKVRTLIARDFDAAFEQADVLVSPTAPTTAFKLGEKVDDPLAMYLNDLATIPANLSGVPGISVPSGLADEDGLPAGVQILAPALHDDRVYRVGAALEALLVREWGGPLLDQAPAFCRSRDRGGQFDDRRAAVVRRGGRAVRPGSRARGPRRAEHRDQDVLRLPDGVRRRAQHPDLPDLPRAAGLDAGGEREGGGVGDPDRARAQLRDRGVVPVRPEELLLPGHAEELPDQPVRRADRVRGLHGRRGRRRDLPGRDRARPHGGGHRQVAARRRQHRPDPRRRLLARRLQPGRHPADRDRHQARARHRREGAGGRPGLRRAAARAAARPRRERRTDGAGLAALRREPLARPEGRRASSAPAPRPRT